MSVRYLIIAVSSLAILSYYAAIAYLAQHAAASDLSVPSGFVTLIGGTLATHFGAVFGLNRANARAGVPKVVLGTLETVAAWAYLASLVLAAGLWARTGFDAKYVEALRNLALTLPGVIAGVLAVALNVGTDATTRADDK